LILINVDPGIDAWLAPRTWSGAHIPGRQPAMALGLAGGALALSRFGRHRAAVIVLGGITGAIAVFALLGYLTGIDTYGSMLISSPSYRPASACSALLPESFCGSKRRSASPGRCGNLVMLGCAIVARLLMYGAYAGFCFTTAQVHDVREELELIDCTMRSSLTPGCLTARPCQTRLSQKSLRAQSSRQEHAHRRRVDRPPETPKVSFSERIQALSHFADLIDPRIVVDGPGCTSNRFRAGHRARAPRAR
jgi:hypothetical protein